MWTRWKFAPSAKFVPELQFKKHRELIFAVGRSGFGDHCSNAFPFVLKQRLDLEPSLNHLLWENKPSVAAVVGGICFGWFTVHMKVARDFGAYDQC